MASSKRNSQRTVKAFQRDIALINEQARILGCTAAEVIHLMCGELRKRAYLQELGESFDLARADAAGFTEFLAEHELWDCSLSDGLRDAS